VVTLLDLFPHQRSGSGSPTLLAFMSFSHCHILPKVHHDATCKYRYVIISILKISVSSVRSVAAYFHQFAAYFVESRPPSLQPRGGGCSRDDLPLPARHCTPCHPASPSGLDGAMARPAMDSPHQPTTRLPASPHAGVDSRSARLSRPAQQCQFPTRHPASPHTGVEGRSAGPEEWLLHPTQHTASSVSPPCSSSAPPTLE
jgi:hypothetical protein